MELTNNKKPCVVKTSQGFSVSYKDRLLYSKYNPSKLILQTINDLELIEGTIVLAISPCLCYGLDELLHKLPKDCVIFLCDFDTELYNLTYNCSLFNNSFLKDKRLFFPSNTELYNLPEIIYNLAKSGKYKRIKRIDFSSGYQFHEELYKQLEQTCVNSIKTFWTNRLTLTKFGRKYSYNLFRNIQNITNTTKIESYIRKIDKPILVFGAGESTDFIIQQYKTRLDNFYILCVDTALSPLINQGIIPNGVFVEEAQTVISKAFICNKHNVQLFAGLSSLPHLREYFRDENISYFTTEYVDSNFLNDLKKHNILPPVNPPFGSVGLTSVYYALQFRANDNIPVFVTGLDFSYSVGKTHCRGSMAHVGRLITNNRLSCIDNLNAAFLGNATAFYDKQHNNFISTPSLSNYCALFNNLFSKENNLFDISNSGLPLSIPRINFSSISFNTKTECIIKKEHFNDEYCERLKNYIINEKSSLLTLRSLLTEKQEISEKELQDKITSLCINKEYLYLHYPDGYNFYYSQSFLNRIRTEIDFFLSILN